MYRGHIPGLLRHPCGAAVVDDLYTAASAQQRTALVAEFYGREFTLFGGSEAVRLPELLTQLPPAKTAAVLRNMTIQLTPVMEKALIDPAITHRWAWYPWHMCLPRRPCVCSYSLAELLCAALHDHSAKPLLALPSHKVPCISI